MNIQSRYTAWIAWFIAALFYAYQYILRVMPNVLLPEIMSKFHVNADQLGNFAGLYYIGYCVMHIPLGLLLDRVGPRIVMPICVALTLAGSMTLIYADNWAYPLAGRFLVGLGSSAAILGLFKVIRQGFEENKFSRLVGVAATIGLLGAIYGGQPMSMLFEAVGWKTGLIYILIVGLILALGMCIFLPKHEYSPAEKTHTIWQDLKEVLCNGRVLVVCFLGGCMVAPLEGFADVWGAEFLRKMYGYSAAESARLTSLIFLGMCIGCPLLTFFADKTRAYYRTILFSAALMGLGFVWVYSGKIDQSSLSVIFTLIGVVSAYQILVIYKATTYVEERLVGVTSAYANMIIMLFGFIFHKIIGKIVQLEWDGIIQNDVHIYSTQALLKALSIVPLGQLIGFVGFIPFVISEMRAAKKISSN